MGETNRENDREDESFAEGDMVSYRRDGTDVLAVVVRPLGSDRYLIHLAPSGPRSALPRDPPPETFELVDQARAAIADPGTGPDPHEPFEVAGTLLSAIDLPNEA